MDLLGSILNSMDKPPAVSDKQKAMMKSKFVIHKPGPGSWRTTMRPRESPLFITFIEQNWDNELCFTLEQREEQEKRQKAEAEKLKNFREQVEQKINRFLKDDKLKEYKFPPMEKVYRTIVHDVAEVASVWAYSFGEEGIDRYIMIFKREYAPSEDQLNTLRRGEEWNDDIARKLQETRELKAKEDAEYAKSRKRKDNFVPNSNYKDKYEHLIGKESALEAARKTESSTSYGFVPSENKKDQRSIEQTLADIRAKKRKLEETNQESDAKRETK